MKTFKKQKGFTLIELLVVIGILAVLLAITLIAINPARQFAQANNTKRRSDVNAILNAVNQYMADNKGSLPAGITETGQEISAQKQIFAQHWFLNILQLYRLIQRLLVERQ